MRKGNAVTEIVVGCLGHRSRSDQGAVLWRKNSITETVTVGCKQIIKLQITLFSHKHEYKQE